MPAFQRNLFGGFAIIDLDEQVRTPEGNGSSSVKIGVGTGFVAEITGGRRHIPIKAEIFL